MCVCHLVDACVEGWGAHGCFLWENGRSEVGGHGGNGAGSDSGQILLDKFLYSRHLLQEDKGEKKQDLSSICSSSSHTSTLRTCLVEYLGGGAVREPCVGLEGDHLRADYGLEFLRRHFAVLTRDHVVHLAVALQDRKVLVAARCLQDS